MLLRKTRSIARLGSIVCILSRTMMGAAASSESSWSSVPRDSYKTLKAGTAPGELATFGAGCYWGTEKYFAGVFAKKHPGAITGRTGHVEVLQIAFDPAKVEYEELVRFFFTFHDPTTENRQENDRGTQYASAIFTHNAKQAEVAARVKAQLQAIVAAGKIDKFATRAVTTAIRPASAFVAADADHQRYLEDNPAGYCNHRMRFAWEDVA